MTAHKWQFTARFRYHAFGWQSDKPIQRIKEALSEIKQVAKHEPALAAAGAVLFLEKISPAIEQVDSSSGAIGSMVNRAIDTLVPIIAKAAVTPPIRQQWLQRLWQALQDDNIPYIEQLGDYWGELCADTECASLWADEFKPSVEQVSQASAYAYFKGSSAYLSSLYAAGRHDELLEILAKPYFKGWWYRQWGVRALLAMGKKAEAIRYAEDSKKIINTPVSAVAKVCEDILLSSGLYEEAYGRYALDANQGTTHLATFRGLVKKYPHKPAGDILRDLVASQPGSEGKWFAAAKDASLFDVAIELVNKSPTDPRTLIRASRDFGEKQADFAVSAGMAALHWMSRGYGYQMTASDVLEAYSSILNAASAKGASEAEIKAQIREVITKDNSGTNMVLATLRDKLIV
ncbi:MAG: hypothetical protein EPN89_02250 [Methylovulum sp.]|nr:MAG: hypothetical protein EPN89_02250 [Methylovulum sp.]